MPEVISFVPIPTRALVLALVLAAACLGSTPETASAQARSPLERPPVTGTFALSGTEWIIEEIDGRPALAPWSHGTPTEPPRATFPPTGGIRIRGGCNAFDASLTAPGGRALTFVFGATTLKACPEQFMQQDQKLYAAVQENATYRHEGDLLWLLDGRGTTRVRLRQAR